MFKFKNICSLGLLISSFILLNTSMYANIVGIIDANANANANQDQGQGNGQGHGKAKGHSKTKSSAKAKNKNANAKAKATKSKGVKFANQDTETITKYYSAHPFPTSTLPPGIAMNLARGKPLPPGIQKVFLPDDLLTQLPVYPGYDYIAAGKDIILIDQKTDIVADILSDVLR
jgi:hypothetical protein